jgi:hypothetical protein
VSGAPASSSAEIALSGVISAVALKRVTAKPSAFMGCPFLIIQIEQA